jgi:hypothetical protein
MSRYLAIFVLLSVFVSCTKDNKIDKTEDSFIWPLQKGNVWIFKGFKSFRDGGTKDTTGLVLEIDSIANFRADEYFSVKGDYDTWYRSAKGQVFEMGSSKDAPALLARNVSEKVTLHEETGIYSYFEVPAATFNGSLTRIAYPEVTVINTYNCAKTEDVYKDETGNIVQKKTVFYSINNGPVCYKYYGNRETLGDPNLYLLHQFTIDSIYIKK